MKYLKYTIGLVSLLLVSCSNQETEVTIPKSTEEPEFYASIEGSSTRVYVDEDLNVLWNAEDQVSIFNKNTYNQPYKFLGNTGDNAGGFNKVDVAEFVTGKPITNIVSVYPYQEDTQISESGVLTVTLPKEQTYSEKTFGMGTNTMVSVSTDNYLQFKNVGGYLKLRMYGEGVSISTIILKGNNNEKLSGKAYITMPLEGTPSVEMASDAETEVILNSKNSVLLGSTAENCTDFWFVLPPVTFSKGFTIIVKRKDGQAFTKTASSPVTITRNNLLNMAPFEVKMEGTQPNNVIYYTTSDSKVITPRSSFGLISNNYVDGIGILTFNQDVTYIPSYCFQNCSSLTSISLPESIISIERSAFQNCSGLTGNLYLPEGLTRIGAYAFQNCSALTGNLTIPSGVTSIGDSAFEGCSGFSGSLTIQEGVATIEDYAFKGCSGFAGDLSIPSGVNTIGNGAFSGCSGFTGNLILPKGVAYIGYSAFEGCSGFSGSLTMQEGVTTIGNYAFYGCSGFAGSLIIPKGVASIGDSAFSGCSGFSGSLTIQEGVTNIGNRAFYGCSGFTGNLIIPKGVASIGNSAFEGCSGFSGDLTIQEGVTTIGNYAFSSCSGFTGNLTIPKGVAIIGDNAFEGCSGFTGSLTIQEGVITIGNYAFSGCSGFNGTLSIKPGVTSIGFSAFYKCSGFIGDLILPEGLSSIGNYAFYNCIGFNGVLSIPEGVSRIGNSAFSGCSGFTGNLNIPEGVTIIEVYAFYKCSGFDGSLFIPLSVTSIGDAAFYGCERLTNINIKPSIPPAGGNNMFAKTNLCPIYIPSGSEEAYANAEHWNRYAMRMRVEGSNSSIAYCSSDYSQDGEVIQLQKATVGRGINIIFLGDGFLDKDMVPGGKYEQKMREGMEQFFAYEPYYTFRNRFNIYAVKVISKNEFYGDESSDRRLTYEEGDNRYFRTSLCTEYAQKVPNEHNQPLKICTLCNTTESLGRSWCFWSSDGWGCCIVYDKIGPVLNHELGGHAFGRLYDEYVEKQDSFSYYSTLDTDFYNYGWGANVDWHSNPDEVRWSCFLKDSRYQKEGLGVFEGGYLYAHGIYRATENSMMRYNDTPFNAPSREQIYKMIMKYSEGEDWVYDYEEFVKADERGRMEAAEELGPWKSPRRATRSLVQENNHHPPVLVDQSVKEVGFDKDGKVIIVR